MKISYLTCLFICRLQNELFQDDLFPPTRVTWEATLSANDWFNNKDKKVRKISLKPEGMESCMYTPSPLYLSQPLPQFNLINFFIVFVIQSVSSTLPPQSQPQQNIKKTDPPSNILQSYNRQWNTDNEKFKQDEVSIN